MQKRKRMELSKKILWSALQGSLAVLFCCTPVYASGTGSAITQPLTTLLSLVTDFVTGIGSIVTLFGIFEFGNAQQTQDGAAKPYALQRIGGGLIMVVAPQLLQMFT